MLKVSGPRTHSGPYCRVMTFIYNQWRDRRTRIEGALARLAGPREANVIMRNGMGHARRETAAFRQRRAGDTARWRERLRCGRLPSPLAADEWASIASSVSSYVAYFCEFNDPYRSVVTRHVVDVGR